MNFQKTRSRTALLSVLLVAIALLGCERQVAQRRVSWHVKDPLATGLEHVKEWDRSGTPSGVIWAHGRIVADEQAYAQRSAPLPAESLFRVELKVLPRVDCSANPQHNHFPPQGLSAYPGRMAPEALADFGDAGTIRELWVVPARIGRGTGLPVNYKPWAASDPNFPDEPDGPSFNLGPAWFGTPLRQAGLGRWVYFPAIQDCSVYQEARGVDLPTRLFEEHRGTGYDPDAVLTISAVTPFIARVVETCPVRIEEKEERLSVLRFFPQNNDIRPLVDVWRYSGKVTGQCSGGERVFVAKSRDIPDRPWFGGPFYD